MAEIHQFESIASPPKDQVWQPTYDWILTRFPFLKRRSLQEACIADRALFGVRMPRSFRVGKVRASTEAELERWYAEVVQQLARQYEDQARNPPNRSQ